MKKLIPLTIAALISTPVFSTTMEHNINVGFCTAFHVLRSQGDTPTSTPALTEIIFAQATDYEIARLAGHKFVDLFEKDREKAIKVGFLACRKIGVQ